MGGVTEKIIQYVCRCGHMWTANKADSCPACGEFYDLGVKPEQIASMARSYLQERFPFLSTEVECFDAGARLGVLVRISGHPAPACGRAHASKIDGDVHRAALACVEGVRAWLRERKDNYADWLNADPRRLQWLEAP